MSLTKCNIVEFQRKYTFFSASHPKTRSAQAVERKREYVLYVKLSVLCTCVHVYARKTRACSVRHNNVVVSLHIIEFACRVIIIIMMIEVEIEMEIIVYLSHAHQSGPLLPLLVELLYDELL